MNHSLQSKTDGVAFSRPVFTRSVNRFIKRTWRNLEWMGRRNAASQLARHGYHKEAKNLLEGTWK